MKKIDTIKNIIQIQNITIIGSYADDNLDYKGDIDLQDIIKTNISIDDILPMLVDRYKQIESLPETYITDFKAGYYSGKPIKWNYNDLKRGYKRFDNDLRIYFRDILTQDSIIKIDIVSEIGRNYIEISNNYYFIFNNYKTFRSLTKNELDQKMLYDYRMKKDKDIYKALKRLYIYYKNNKETQKANKLQKLFNSDIGKLNKRLSELETIRLLISNKKRPRKSKIIDAIYNINKDLGKYKEDKLINLENKTLGRIGQIIDYTIDKNKEILTAQIDKYILSSRLNNILK